MDPEPESNQPEQKVAVREARLLVWGPIYITINLQKTPTTAVEKQELEAATQIHGEGHAITPAEKQSERDKPPESINQEHGVREPILSGKGGGSSSALHDAEKSDKSESGETKISTNDPNQKKVTYIYNHIDHGLNCDCIDVKGELLIRSALPLYRKISQGIEYEQVTSNQIKLIITSRVLDNYQEVFQGFTTPKATFRVWVMGYRFGH
ncbi:MAG: hypothetical protein SFT81_04245 [Candidatus Caenarcaniphilales bacterium]|nr:hypothetical protein [Candidatus Caenarcaniphilales bacterium]